MHIMLSRPPLRQQLAIGRRASDAARIHQRLPWKTPARRRPIQGAHRFCNCPSLLQSACPHQFHCKRPAKLSALLLTCCCQTVRATDDQQPESSAQRQAKDQLIVGASGKLSIYCLHCCSLRCCFVPPNVCPER